MKGSMPMQSVLAIDVAKGKSMVSLISSCGEVLIEPYEINHSINDFTNLLNRIKKQKLDNVSVIMESTSIYHRPVERYFLENNFKVFVINALYSKMYKRNLRKTKTDRLDRISLSELFFTTDFREYIKPDDIYLNMNALSRQYHALDELCVNLKNRYKNLVYLCFPEYELIFKKKTIYSDLALSFIEKYPHADIISNTRIDTLQNFFKKNRFRYWKKKTATIKELTAYCGLDPSIKQSGKSINIKGPISKSGNKYLRKILFVSVLNILCVTKLCHIENDIETYYRKKRNEGKHHYVATIACTTKLLRQIFVLCKQLDK